MKPPLDPDFVARLRGHAAGPEPAPDAGLPPFARAAVAALLRPRAGELELLLMVRTRRDNDRWSGQVCMPGGRVEPEDVDLIATARRETREELGFDPADAGELVGRLSPIRARARGGLLPLVIQPYVWLAERDVEARVGPEAEDHFWLPLSAAARGDLDGTLRLVEAGSTFVLPTWTFAERVVWGLTHRMASELLDVVTAGRKGR